MSEENAGISICRRNFSQGSYSNIIFPLVQSSRGFLIFGKISQINQIKAWKGMMSRILFKRKLKKHGLKWPRERVSGAQSFMAELIFQANYSSNITKLLSFLRWFGRRFHFWFWDPRVIPGGSGFALPERPVPRGNLLPGHWSNDGQ